MSGPNAANAPRYHAREVKSVIAFTGDPTLAEAAGIDVAHLDDPDATIPLSAYYELLERAAAVTRNPHFGCHFALDRQHGAKHHDGGALWFLVTSSPNLRVMGELLLRFQKCWNSGDVFEVEERAGELVIRYLPWGPWREAHRYAAEKTVADILALFRRADPACEPSAVRLPHGPNGGACKLESSMKVRPTYGAAWTEVVLPSAAADKPLPTANRNVFRLSERYLTLRAAGVPEPEQAFPARVRNVVTRLLAEGRCDQQSVARLLGCGGRTLQRRLADEGLTLREIIDQVRRDRARPLLEIGTSITDVACALGYSEPSAFHRAYRRWYGVSPTALADTALNSSVAADPSMPLK